MPIPTGILGIIGGGVEIAKQILIRKNTQESRKYVDEYLEAEKALLAERSKPMEDQLDNVVEHFEAKLKILFEAAKQAYIADQAGK